MLGQRSRAMGYTVDGINGKEPGIGNTNGTDAQISTTQDAFEEVKLYTTGAPAELGHSAGGLMSIVFKSGTNQLHGSVEERYIDKAMIHRAYLEQLPRESVHVSRDDVSVQRSARIPKLYNGKTKRSGWPASSGTLRTREPIACAPRCPRRRCTTATSLSAGRPIRGRCRSTIPFTTRLGRNYLDARSLPRQHHPQEPVRSRP